MAQLDQIKTIIMGMKSQSKNPIKAQNLQTEGSAALDVTAKPIKISEPMHIIKGGKRDNNYNSKQDNKYVLEQSHCTNSEPTMPSGTHSNPIEQQDNTPASICTNDKIKAAVRQLVFGTDYGNIPSIKGNILFKKGALKLLQLCNFKHHDTLLEKNVDVANGFIGYTVKVVILNENTEPIAEAIASANSKEKKFADKGFSSDYLLVNMAQKRALVQAVKELLI